VRDNKESNINGTGRPGRGLNYFLKTKNTARTKKTNARPWFHLRLSFLNNKTVNIEKTRRVITSWMTLS